MSARLLLPHADRAVLHAKVHHLCHVDEESRLHHTWGTRGHVPVNARATPLLESSALTVVLFIKRH